MAAIDGYTKFVSHDKILSYIHRIFLNARYLMTILSKVLERVLQYVSLPILKVTLLCAPYTTYSQSCCHGKMTIAHFPRLVINTHFTCNIVILIFVYTS